MRFTHAVLGASASCLVLMSSSLMAQSTAPAGSSASKAPTATASKAAAELSAGDKRLLENTAQSGYSEIEGSKLALDKTKSPKIRAYAQRMIKDHGTMQKDLEALAKRKGFELPTEPSLAQRAQLKALGALNGTEFEKMYSSHIAIAGHDNTVLAFQNATTQTEDPDVQAFAKKHIGMLRDHLDGARQIGPTDHGM